MCIDKPIVKPFLFNTVKRRSIPLTGIICLGSIAEDRAFLVNEYNVIRENYQIRAKAQRESGYTCSIKRGTSRWQSDAVRRDDLPHVQTPPAPRPVHHGHLSTIELNTRPARRVQLISAAINEMNSYRQSCRVIIFICHQMVEHVKITKLHLN